MSEPPPWADVASRAPLEPKQPGLVVDLARCIGCHACSVACKTEHGIPLGEFPLRVRWLPRPDRPTFAFVPVFDAELCDLGANRAKFGMEPACVTACPTQTITFGDRADAAGPLAKLKEAEPLEAPEAKLHPDVTYLGAESWFKDELHQGPRLDPRDRDPIYEQ